MKVRARLVIGLLSGVIGLTTASFAAAQGRYEQLPLSNPPKNFVEVKKEAGPLGQPSKDVIKAAVEFRMAKMTEGKEAPDKARSDMDADLKSIVAEDGLAVANKTVLDLGSKVAKGNYLPAARVNAMLAIAELYEGPANARTTPYTGALGELYNCAINVNLPCHLRAIALHGLNLHVYRGKTLNEAGKAAADRRSSVAQAMVTIISSQPTLVQEEQAHWWMVRRAYDVLLGLQAAGERAKEGLSPGLRNAAVLAMDQFNDPTQLVNIRYSAGTFLTRLDFTAMKQPAFRVKLFLGVAQFLDQEVVGWYEHESDKTKMQSGGMGMGGMGMGGGMGDMMSGGMGDMMSGGMGGMEGGMGGMGDGGMGMPGGSGGRGGQTGPKPIDSQQWDLRIARRKLDMYTQLSHALLKGTLSKDERDYNASGKGVMEVPLPESHVRAGKFLIEALEEVQETVNERSLTTVGSLMTRLLKPLTKLRDAAELIPAYEEPDPADKTKKIEVVKSFKDYSPRMKSFKKADASGKLEAAIKAPPADGEGKAPGAPAAPGTPAAPGAPAPAGAEGAKPATPPAPAANPPQPAAGANPVGGAQ